MLPDSSKQYPLTIDRVKKVKSLNEQGVIPDELEAVELTSSKPKEVEPEFVDVVGHISLRSLEKSDKKRSQQRQQQRQQQRPQQKQPGNQYQKGPQNPQGNQQQKGSQNPQGNQQQKGPQNPQGRPGGQQRPPHKKR